MVTKEKRKSTRSEIHFAMYWPVFKTDERHQATDPTNSLNYNVV